MRGGYFNYTILSQITLTNALSILGNVWGQAGTTLTGMRELTSSLPPKEGTENSWWSVAGEGVADKEREEM